MIKELFIIGCIIMISVISTLLVVGAVDTYLEKCNCKRTAQITEKEYKFDWIAGCFYKENDKWIKQY